MISAGTGLPPHAETTGPQMVTAVFHDREDAERAYKSLLEKGYDKEDIHLIMSEDTRKRHFKDSEMVKEHEEAHGNKALEGTGVGSAIGGTVGAIVGAIAAIGTTVALPGLGLIVAGPIAAGLAGAGAGGLTGGLVGALVGAGIPEEEAKKYEQHVKEGGVVMGVRPRDKQDEAAIHQRWKDCNAAHVHC